MKISEKYFKKLSKKLMSKIENENVAINSTWNMEIPEPVRYWAKPIEIKNKILWIFVKDRTKRQSFLGENEKIIVNKFQKSGFHIKNLKIKNENEQ